MIHKSTYVKHNGESIKIDSKIAPLISMMWELNINTIGCCQNHCRPLCNHSVKKIKYDDGSILYKKILTKQCHKYIWIVFDHAKDVELFYNYVGEYSEKNNSMYSKMNGQCYKGNNKNSNWILEVFPINRGEEQVLVKKPVVQADGLKDQSFIELYETAGCSNNEFNMMIQLYIPIRHLSYIENRLKLALDNR